MKNVILILVMSALLASCSNKNHQYLYQGSPEIIVKQFSTAMYQGNLDEALKYIANPQKNKKALQDSITKIREMGGWKFYRVIDTEYSSNKEMAIVETQSEIPSIGKRVGGKTTLRLVNGVWKIFMEKR